MEPFALVVAIWVLLDLVLMFTGKVVVWLISLGHWRGEQWTTEEARIHGAAGALSFVREGQRVVTGLGLSIIGGLFYFVLLIGLVIR